MVKPHEVFANLKERTNCVLKPLGKTSQFSLKPAPVIAYKICNGHGRQGRALFQQNISLD